MTPEWSLVSLNVQSWSRREKREKSDDVVMPSNGIMKGFEKVRNRYIYLKILVIEDEDENRTIRGGLKRYWNANWMVKTYNPSRKC